MNQAIRILPHLELYDINNQSILDAIYSDLSQDYYWSEDFSPELYIAQAKAGFIAVTETHKERELLLPEMQKSYAILDFDDLHISKKVRRLMSKGGFDLSIGLLLDTAYQHILTYHKHSWITPRYLNLLKRVNGSHNGVTVVSVLLKHKGVVTAGELGYIIGSTYTSLSGFSSRAYSNHGTLQLVLLSQWLEKHGFAFWNLGQPYMPYKFVLGAKRYDRNAYLQRWSDATANPLSGVIT